MRIAVISDIHDNVWKLAAVLGAVRETDMLICCGDLCSPFVVHQMGRGFPKPVHIVFGNNDGDLFRITASGHQYSHVHIHGELFQGEFGGKRIAMNHYDSIAGAIAASGQFDVVCYGHNHIYDVSRVERTLMINPGAIMGATFGPDASRTDVASTFVIYDTALDKASGYQVVAGGEAAIRALPS